jgi:CDP-glucose 4,6-dehydratase
MARMDTDGIDQSFWQDKRIFLTGHTGFKGSWLSMMLSRMGAVVCGYALNPPTTPSLYDAADVGA